MLLILCISFSWVLLYIHIPDAYAREGLCCQWGTCLHTLQIGVIQAWIFPSWLLKGTISLTTGSPVCNSKLPFSQIIGVLTGFPVCLLAIWHCILGCQPYVSPSSTQSCSGINPYSLLCWSLGLCIPGGYPLG